MHNLPTEDAATYRMIAEGHTVGLFELESSAMTETARKIRPTTMEDIIAIAALFRPGPKDSVELYVRSKDGGAPVYPHPDWSPSCATTTAS